MKVGRKKIILSYDFIVIHNRVKNGLMSIKEACDELQITQATYYRIKRQLEVHHLLVDRLRQLEIEDDAIERIVEEVDELL